jgi:pimeloyl-ACP methyl ester carboxylesterase
MCTQLGWFYTANPDRTKSVAPAGVTLSYYRQICRESFGITGAPATKQLNHKYYETLLNPKTASRILFISGSADPFIRASIAVERGNHKSNPNIEAFTIPGAGHCFDASGSAAGDPPVLKAARLKILMTLENWLRSGSKTNRY